MINTLRRVLTLIAKEFSIILREPRSRFVVIGPPIIQFFVLGYAATFDLNDVPYAVLDEARTVDSRQLLARFEGSRNFKLERTLQSADQIAGAIDPGEVTLVVHIPADFSDTIRTGGTAPVQVIADGRNSNVAAVALGYVANIVRTYNADWARRTTDGSRPAGPEVVERAWFNENLESRWYIVSALGGVISMIVVLLLTSLSVAREREFGTFDQLLVAPFRPAEILAGKAVPGVIFGIADALVLVAGAVFWFGVPFRGGLTALVLVLAAFMIAVVGIGLFISSLSKTMQQALLGSLVFIMPAVILGGFATPIQNMPDWLQTGTLINPLRYVVAGLREVFLVGAGIADVWPRIWPMLIIGGVTLPIAGWMFRRRTG